MELALIILAILIVVFIVIKIAKLAIKIVVIALAVVAIAATIGFSANKPDEHKPFAMSVIDYIVNFNNDGSVTTTKQVTTHQVNKVAK